MSCLVNTSKVTNPDVVQRFTTAVYSELLKLLGNSPLECFIFQEIDGKALLLLPSNALEALTENKLGPITKLMDALQSLKKMWGLHS